LNFKQKKDKTLGNSIAIKLIKKLHWVQPNRVFLIVSKTGFILLIHFLKLAGQKIVFNS